MQSGVGLECGDKSNICFLSLLASVEEWKACHNRAEGAKLSRHREWRRAQQVSSFGDIQGLGTVPFMWSRINWKAARFLNAGTTTATAPCSSLGSSQGLDRRGLHRAAGASSCRDLADNKHCCGSSALLLVAPQSFHAIEAPTFFPGSLSAPFRLKIHRQARCCPLLNTVNITDELCRALV